MRITLKIQLCMSGIRTAVEGLIKKLKKFQLQTLDYHGYTGISCKHDNYVKFKYLVYSVHIPKQKNSMRL